MHAMAFLYVLNVSSSHIKYKCSFVQAVGSIARKKTNNKCTELQHDSLEYQRDKTIYKLGKIVMFTLNAVTFFTSIWD